jgi:hypothetical protein
VKVQADEASVARGHSAQWKVSVSAENGSVSNVKLSLATSPSSQKPKFTTNGTTTYSAGTVKPGSTKTLQAQVHIAASATSVRSVKLTVASTGTRLNPGPKTAVPINVTAPKAKGTASASPSASAGAGAGGAGRATPGSGVLTPAGVRSTLGVGGLPFVSAAGAKPGLQPSLSPGGNASSLFPTLNPSGRPGSGGTSRIRPLADSLPGDASLMGAQYAGLVALALAFILSVTRLSIRRRQSAARSSAGPNS